MSMRVGDPKPVSGLGHCLHIAEVRLRHETLWLQVDAMDTIFASRAASKEVSARASRRFLHGRRDLSEAAESPTSLVRRR
jgi:hypothetical protein